MSDIFTETDEEKAFFASETEAPEPTPEPTPEPEPAPEPESKQESLPESKPEPEERKVDLRALQEERIKRRELERRLEEMEKRLAGKQEPEQPAIPDPEADPIAALKHLRDQHEAFQKQQAQQQQEAALRQHVDSLEREFRKANNDYDTAIQHLQEQRVAELQIMGFTDPNQIRHILRADAQVLIQNALNAGVNPAEWAYKMAQHRGYAKAAPPAPPPVVQPSPQVQRIAKQAPAAKSLSGAGGNPSNNLTIEALAGLSDDDFDAAFEKMWKNT